MAPQVVALVAGGPTPKVLDTAASRLDLPTPLVVGASRFLPLTMTTPDAEGVTEKDDQER